MPITFFLAKLSRKRLLPTDNKNANALYSQKQLVWDQKGQTKLVLTGS